MRKINSPTETATRTRAERKTKYGWDYIPIGGSFDIEDKEVKSVRVLLKHMNSDGSGRVWRIERVIHNVVDADHPYGKVMEGYQVHRYA